MGYQSKNVKVQIIAGINNIADLLLEKGNSSSDIDTTDIDYDDILAPKLLVQYKFDGDTKASNSGLLDLISSGISYTTDKEGNVGKAAMFSGLYSSYALSDYSSAFNLDEFTYSFWLNPSQNFGVDYNDYIDFISRWGNWGVGNQSFAFSLSKLGSLKLMFYNQINSQKDHPNNYTMINTADNIKPNQWTHIAISFNSLNSAKVYINGNNILSIQSVKPQYSTIYGICIGKRYDDYQNSYYKGAIDDLKIFKKALTDNEIKFVFNSKI